jgi:F0F1-type ATP synthase membrane subunit b/b'
MQLNWWTFALQAINFLVLVWLLRRFLYKPAKAVIDRRKELAERAFADADKAKADAEAARQGFESQTAGLAQERRDMLKKVHAEIEAERGKILEDAKAEAERATASSRDCIAEERRAALAEMREEAAALAVDLATDLLRKTAATTANDAFLAEIESQLAALPADERERLERDLAANGARLTVVTASELGADEKARWVSKLNTCLGHRDQTEFVADPDIVGGVELHFPHAVLRYSWADQLEKAKELLTGDGNAA